MGRISGPTAVPAVSSADPVGGKWYWIDKRFRTSDGWAEIIMDGIRVDPSHAQWEAVVDLPRLYVRGPKRGGRGVLQVFVHESLINDR
jgi:hypothetical protein